LIVTIRKTAAIGGVLAMALAVVAIVQAGSSPVIQISGDLKNAAVAEVHDAQGQVLLRGNFVPVDADDEGEVERLAALSATAPGVTGSGEAEVEYQTDTPDVQEVELALAGMTPGVEVALVIDGARITSAKADSKGRVEVEIEVRAGAQ
jgi:hypothetical protein